MSNRKPAGAFRTARRVCAHQRPALGDCDVSTVAGLADYLVKGRSGPPQHSGSCDPPRFVSGEQVRRRPPAGFIFEIQAPFALSRRKHGFESPRERHEIKDLRVVSDAWQAKTKDRPRIARRCAVVCGRLVKFAQLA